MRRTIKDNLIYLAVAGVIVAGLLFSILYTDKVLGRIPAIPGPILWGILSTPTIMALVLERYWRSRHRPILWVVSFAAAFINVCAMLAAYSLRWSPRPVVWSSITALWVMVVFIIAEKLLAGTAN